MTSSSLILGDTGIASDLLGYEVGFSINETVYAHDTLRFDYFPGGGISELAEASFSVGASFTYHILMSERVIASTSQRLSFVQFNSFSATATGTFVATLAHNNVEKATATGTFLAQTTYRPNMTARAVATDVLDLVTGAYSLETAHASDAMTYQYTAGAAVSDTAVAHSMLSDTLVHNAAIEDSANVQDIPTANFNWSVSLVDTAWASIQREPSNSVATWAINTRTNAVTQYRNWSFNSFAALGRKYLAADANGLYELNGPRDLTSNVVGSLQGGFFQPADGKLAGFKGVYLAVNGQGTWQLTLTAGDQRTYVYQRYSQPGLMTTKMEIGKGLRSTYFGWGLTAIDGQDFDLDRISFVPMISGRRIG
jgi:hypothetical protein